MAAPAEPPARVLFLGDGGHHQPAEGFAQLKPVLESRGIELVYTDSLADLDPKVLAAYDALAVYANIDTLPPATEAVILDFVRNGNGFGGFASWDETYVHTKHNDRERTVLEERVEGDGRLAASSG